MDVDLYELPDESLNNGSQVETTENSQEIHENSGSVPPTYLELRRSSRERIRKKYFEIEGEIYNFVAIDDEPSSY